MQRLKEFLIVIYGVYAALAVSLCVVVAGAMVLLAPGLTRRRRIARRGLRTAFFCAGMPFKVAGLERLPGEPCIAIANHRSYLDGLVLIAALPERFTPVIKTEVSQVPIISKVLERVGARYVQREPAMQAGRDTKRLLDAVRDGESLAVFPEGTFSVDDGLLPFRGGAFFLATKAGVPVVPVAIEGSRDVLPVDVVLPRPASVTVQVLESLRTDSAERDAAQALRDRTEEVLWHSLKPRTPAGPQATLDYDYYRDVFKDSALPQAYLDLDVLEDNIRTVLTRSGGKWLRVDARALRCPALVLRVLRSNVRFYGAKCATGFEAAYLAREWDLEDVLVAYPTLQHDAITHVCAAIADGCGITMTADSPTHLARLSEAAQAAGVTMPVCVEMDMSAARGSRRSPLRTTDDLLALLDVIADDGHLHFRGVLAFDTQRSNVPAWFASPRGRGRLARRLDADAQRWLHQRRREVAERLAAHGYTPDLFNGGGAGGIELNAADPSITEISIGSALFAPELGEDDFQHAPAAGLALEVMRRPGHDLYNCLGGGYTAADTTSPDALPHPYLPAAAVLERPGDAGEAHMPIRYAGELRLGDPVFLRPPNAGELCERFSTLQLIQGGAIVGSAPTYRALGDQLR